MDNVKDIFLATTALDKFWKDDNKTVIFLGEWCKAFKEESYFNNKIIFPFIWTDAKQIDDAACKCWDYYEEIIILLTDLLNNLHSVKKSKKYWECIIGNWLYTFIHVIYDRYHVLKKFIEKYPDFETLFLAEDSYVIPMEYLDFVEKICNDEYNLQLFSQILKFMGYNFKSLNHNLGQKFIYIKKSNTIKKLFFKTLNILTFNAKVTITSPYFSDSVKSYFKLYFSSRGLIKFDEFEDDFKVELHIDRIKRTKLKSLYNGNDVFLKLFFSLLPQNFPLLFLEGYLKMKSYSFKKGTPKTKIYATGNALNSNYLYKFWIAEFMDNITLISIQHGGGYRVYFKMPPEKYERKISDFFFTWGWKESKNTIPTTHEKICKKIKPQKNGYILFVQTQNPRYMLRLQSSYNSSAMLLTYLPKAISFFENVGKLKRFLFRGYIKDHGFEVGQRICDKFPEMPVDDYSYSFHDRLKKARIAVFDHMHTTYLETLAMNFPTLIFIDPNYYSFRNLEIIKKLVNAKILFYDEKKAANHLNEVYNDIDGWWWSDEVQKAREDFCSHYARTSENWANEWIETFRNILK